MDDIAKALGISKKTIYLHYKDKDEIVYAVTEWMLQIDMERCQHIYKVSTDPIDEILQSTQLMRDLVENIHPALLYDLEKYHPKAWANYVNHKNGFVDIILRNLNEGQACGYYRADFEPEILARFRLESVDSVFKEKVFPSKKFKLVDIQLQLIDHFLRGILTPEGLRVYEAYKSKVLAKQQQK
jgi:AcrR family transcriptional regulator